MVDYAPPWDGVQRDGIHGTHDMPLAQVKNSAAALAALLDEGKEEQVLKEACLGLCQLFGEGIQNDRIQAILEADVVPKLVALLRPSKSRSVPISVQSAALQVLGNVACGDDRQTQVVIDSDALPCLRALLSSADRGIRKEVCWIISNITESSHQVQDVLDADILPPLLKLLENQDAACREDATWVLFNLSSNRDPNQIAYLAEKNGVRALCNLLNCSKDLDVMWKGCGTVAAVALKGLRNILISGQIEAATDPAGYNKMASLVAEAHGVERIEALTTHISLDVRTRARLLLERMFGAEPTTADLSPPLPPPPMTSLSTIHSPPPPPAIGHTGCSCYQNHPSPYTAYPNGLYDVAGNINASTCLHPSQACLHPSPHINHSIGVEHSLSAHAQLQHEGDLVEVQGSSSGSSTDSEPEDDDSDSDLIPPPPAPCSCVLCTDPSPLADRRPRGKALLDDSDFQKRSGVEGSADMRQICRFCSGGGRLGDGRAGLAAKLGRAVRLGHPHCLAILLSRMTWSQRNAAIEAPALLHPGGGPPDGGMGSSLPAVVLAAQLGKPECLSLLLRRCQPDLDVKHGKKRLTALAWAAHKGYLRCCQLLIEYGSNPLTKCGEGVTALHLAASGGGHLAICKLLIDHKAQVNARSAKKQTALCLAAQKGFGKVVQLLLEHGADPNNEDESKYTPLHLSSSYGYVDCVDLLLKAGARVDATTRNGVTPLHYAVQGGHAQVVKLLISSGAKVNCNRKPLLLIAADDGNIEVVKILLSAHAAVDCKANIKAMLDKDVEVLDYLTPLHLASSKGHARVVDALLSCGARVNEVTSKSGWSALDFAVLNGHPNCAITLLNSGATVTDNCKNIGRNNWTLIQYAAHHQEKEVVRLLVQRVKEQQIASSTMNTANGDASSVPNGHMPPFSTNHMSTGIGGTIRDDRERGPNFTHAFPNGNETEPAQYMHMDGNHVNTEPRHDSIDEDRPNLNSYSRYVAKSLTAEESSFSAGSRHTGPSAETPSRNQSRRRATKDDRQNELRARELKKREAEAIEARERLHEAIAQRSISKLTEAIAHVSKLVLHLATSGGGDVTSGGGHVDHSDMNGYGSHPDTYSHNHVHSPSGHSKHSNNVSSSVSAAPLPIEVGLGNEVKKARKILASLLAEDKRAREEKEKEVEETKRENTQQTVRKAITAALEGGDPRSLVRVTNRAVRTILDEKDPVVIEALSLSALIAELEKWESERKTAVSKKDLDGLEQTLPEVSRAVAKLQKRGGSGAASRAFGGSDPSASLKGSAVLLKELQDERESELQREARAKDFEKKAHIELKKAIECNHFRELEDALDQANSALLSKKSELASTMETGKKLLTKRLKSERRKLRQASNTNDPDVIEKAALVADAYGVKGLQGEIETAKELAKKLRMQAAASQQLEDAISSSDITALTEIRSQLTSLGMFAESEQARSELERLQRAKRARNLLEGAINDAKELQEPFNELLLRYGSKSTDKVELNASWKWPDAQRLVDLSDRARKYGQAMQPLCTSADKLAKELCSVGRRVLALTLRSDDARGIAAAISSFEKSFVNVSKPDAFNTVANEKAVREAKARLAEVQAMDQASVKAESAQAKVEYALASSRRSAARTRSSKNTRVYQNGTSANGIAHDNLQNSSNGATSIESGGRSPASACSDFGDDDGVESAAIIPTGSISVDKGESRRTFTSRRVRVPTNTVDGLLLDGIGDVPAPVGECSHYYLFKEGTTVRCARCNHLRTSGNPEWLSRVKRRGNKMPTEIPASLPSVGSAPDLQSSLLSLGSQLGNGLGSPNSVHGSSTLDRGIGRSTRSVSHSLSVGLASNGRDVPRAPPGLGGRTNPHPGSMNMMAQLIQQQQQHHLHPYQQPQSPRTAGRSHMAPHHNQSGIPSFHLPYTKHPVAQSETMNLRGGKPTQVHRGRARPLMTGLPTGLDQHHGAGMAGMYPGAISNGHSLLGGASLPMSANYSTSNLQSLAGTMNAVSGPMHGYGLRGMSTLNPKASMSIPGDVLLSQRSMFVEGFGPPGHQTVVRGPSSRSTGTDDVALSTSDLRTDFENQNFGFDIGAIVDDTPPPGPTRASRVLEPGTRDNGRGFNGRSVAQHNGYYQR